MKKETERFLKLFIGFFAAIVIFILLENPQDVLDGIIDALK